MRKFYLRNALGQTYDLNRKDAFFYQPNGLGFSRRVEYIEAGQKWVELSNSLEQGVISGTMIFRGYEQFTEFKKFVARTPLTLTYIPYGTNEYLTDCIITQLDKTEISEESGRLECDIAITAVGTWYHLRTFQSGTATATEQKIYPRHYPTVYGTSNNTATVWNMGDLSGYCRLIIWGPAVNPVWSIHGSDYDSSGRLLTTLSAGEYLVMDSDPTKLELSVYDSQKTAKSVYDASDFGTARFIMVPVGESVLRVSDAGGQPIQFAIEVRECAETV